MPTDIGKYNYNFTKEKYDRVSILLPKGTKQEITEKTGESVNAFVNRAVREKLDSIDEETQPAPQETQPELKPTFRVDSMDYPTGMLDSKQATVLEDLRKRQEPLLQKREAARQLREEFRDNFAQTNEKSTNNIGELFMNLRLEQEKREAEHRAKETASAEEPDTPPSPSDGSKKT